MKKILLCATLLSAIPSFSHLPMLDAKVSTLMQTNKGKVLKAHYSNKDLTSAQSQVELELLLKELITYVLEQKDQEDFQSVFFSLQVNPQEKEFIIKEIEFYNDNSFAVGLTKIFESSSNAKNQIDCDGITISANQSDVQEDLSKSTLLANEIMEILHSDDFKTNKRIVSSIDITYQNIQ
ncbi:hypothetical protein ACYSNM_04055 [Myroides sp. LJL116]